MADIDLATRPGCFDGAIPLKFLQVPRTQDYQGGSGQNDGQLQYQHQPGALVHWAFRFHPGLLILTLAWISPNMNILCPAKTGVKRQ